MKKNIPLIISIIALLFAIAVLFTVTSCKKDLQHEKNKPATFAADQNKKVISNKIVEGYSFDYSCLTKKLQLICKRVTEGSTSNIVLSDTSGKTVYASLTINDVTGVISNILTPNSIPFEKILPPGTYPNWASCMADAIKKCAALGSLCPCRGEWIAGCLIGWSISCIGKYQVPINPVTGSYWKLPITNNLGAMHP